MERLSVGFYVSALLSVAAESGCVMASSLMESVMQASLPWSVGEACSSWLDGRAVWCHVRDLDCVLNGVAFPVLVPIREVFQVGICARSALAWGSANGGDTEG